MNIQSFQGAIDLTVDRIVSRGTLGTGSKFVVSAGTINLTPFSAKSIAIDTGVLNSGLNRWDGLYTQTIFYAFQALTINAPLTCNASATVDANGGSVEFTSASLFAIDSIKANANCSTHRH